MTDTQGSGASSTAATAPTTIGPLFVAGRQHSGNTVTVVIFGKVPNCYAANVEGQFFERRDLIERIKDPDRRIEAVTRSLRIEDDDLAARTRRHLSDWSSSRTNPSSIELYRQGMDFVTAEEGKAFWVRRATSYIFYAQDILRLMPEARVLYLVRNPFDVCASKKRRNPKQDRFWGWVMSWNRGMRIADTLRQQYPDRFQIIRYEDMVSEPTDTFRAIFDFVGVPFLEEYLDVPHVNRSEAHQTRTSKTRGLNASRVNYYTEILSSAEIAAVNMLVWSEKLREFFPDLPHLQQRPGMTTRLKATWLVATSPLLYIWQQMGTLLRKDTGWQIRRILRRAKILTR
jgi:hypothetical protein